jgi:hypothetical protein
MEGRSPNFYVSALLILIAIIIFVLTVFSVTVGNTTPVEMVAAGLACFAAAHLIP